MNEVERVHEELELIGRVIAASGDLSAIAAYGEHSAKVLLLVSASYFERRILSSIEACINAATNSAVVRHFSLLQAVERKFFSLFDFSADARNINGFLTKFGPDFSKWAKDDMSASGIDTDVQKGFLDLCRLRNNLVHNNFATYNIDKTLAEVRSDYDVAVRLVNWVEMAFIKFHEVNSSAQAHDDGQAVT